MPSVSTDLRLLYKSAVQTINGATGTALDTLAGTYGLTRSGGESDVALTERLIDAIKSSLIAQGQ